MKKRLESELISIAHRILKLKNKSEVEQLYHETQKLYETLSVLKFYNDNFEQLKSVISSDELEVKIENSLVDSPIEKVDKPEIVAKIPEEIVTEKEQVAEEELEEKIEEITTEDEAEIVSEEVIDEVENEVQVVEGEINVEDDDDEIPVVDAKDDLDFEPTFELTQENEEEKLENIKEDKIEKKSEFKKQEPKQISFEDLLGQNYSEPVFVKPNDVVTSIPKKVEEEKVEVIENFKQVENEENLNEVENNENLKQVQIKGEKIATGIAIGLNDRIGFMKNLFGDVTEDFNRVISQLNTFDSFLEAQEFIEDMVKPDYNNWKGKEDYEERFMEIVAKKFE